MLIKTRLYLIAILLIVFSVVALIFTIKNKNAATCKFMTWLCALGIIYLFLSVIVGQLMSLDIGLEILFLYMAGVVAGILYLVSIVINVAKRKKIMSTYFATEFPVPQSLKVIMVIAIALPLLFVCSRIVRDRILIARSDAIFIFHSSGNGGLDDGATFAFALRGESCKRFDLGVDLGIDNMLPKNAVEINTHEGDVKAGPYALEIDEDDRISFLKDGHEVYVFDAGKHDYFNLGVRECYYMAK